MSDTPQNDGYITRREVDQRFRAHEETHKYLLDAISGRNAELERRFWIIETFKAQVEKDSPGYVLTKDEIHRYEALIARLEKLENETRTKFEQVNIAILRGGGSNGTGGLFFPGGLLLLGLIVGRISGMWF